MKDRRAADSLREKKTAVDRELKRLLVLDEGGDHE
jgi:hypothetical protein